MATVDEYLQTWKLKLSTTVLASFHLNNKEPKHDQKLNHNNKTLPFFSKPDYLKSTVVQVAHVSATPWVTLQKIYITDKYYCICLILSCSLTLKPSTFPCKLHHMSSCHAKHLLKRDALTAEPFLSSKWHCDITAWNRNKRSCKVVTLHIWDKQGIYQHIFDRKLISGYTKHRQSLNLQAMITCEMLKG